MCWLLEGSYVIVERRAGTARGGGRFVSRPAVAKPAAPPSAAGLPAGWAEYVDAERGLPYYHHAVSGQTQWEKPTVAAAGQ